MPVQWSKLSMALGLILLAVCGFILEAQNQSLPTIFTIQKLELQLADNPWWQEIYLNIGGYAHPICEDGSLLVSLFYQDRKVQEFELTVQPAGNDNLPWLVFEKQWGPLNNPVQMVVTGSYSAKVELILNRQTSVFQERWKKNFKDMLPPGYNKRLIVGSEEVERQESEKEKLFYVERMQKLNNLFADLETKKKDAFSIRPGKDHAFAEQGKFSANKWTLWLESQFFPQIAAEQAVLNKHQRCWFLLRYPASQSSMEAYTHILLRLAKQATQDLTKAYQQGYTPAHLRKMAGQSRENMAGLVEFIQKIHSQAAVEMKISLREKLGYLPPFKN